VREGMKTRLDIHRAVTYLAVCATLVGSGCANDEQGQQASRIEGLFATESTDYCALPPRSAELVVERPDVGEDPVDDVNWFARPVKHDGTDHIVAFASHNQNYLYNLTRGVRVRIPDRSDAVATPDGRYMTVPSSYTPDANIRFYPMQPLLDGLAAGENAHETEPAFIHEHPSMKRVYYQSTGVVSERTDGDLHLVDYRLMFSGGHDETNFRIVDYRFSHDRETGALLSVEPTPPMALCSAVRNDLNTPFISKDARYVAAYTSERAENTYSPGASLKIFEITATDPAAGRTTCQEVVDFGFAAGKADFSFDGELLAFHISQGGYLTPFINGGLPSSTITDVVVARLELDDRGRIVGHGGLHRLTTSLDAGVGSYFPAFFPDGRLFYVANAVPRDGDADKRFHFRVMDVRAGPWREADFASPEVRALWRQLGTLWESACRPTHPALGEEPFPMKEHEAPWLGLSLSAGQCSALVEDARATAEGKEPADWDALAGLCRSLAA
jgi:hypothetical protein